MTKNRQLTEGPPEAMNGPYINNAFKDASYLRRMKQCDLFNDNPSTKTAAANSSGAMPEPRSELT